MTESHQSRRDDKQISAQCIRTFIGHTGTIEVVAFDAEGKSIISGGSDYTLRTWEANTGSCSRVIELDSLWGDESNCFAISSDGKLVLVGCMQNLPKLFDVESGRLVRTLENFDGSSISVAISRDNKYAVLSNWNDTELWDLTAGKCLKVFGLKGDRDLNSIAFLGRQLAIFAFAVDENRVQLWDLAVGKAIREYEGHTHHVNSVSISQDGMYVASGSDDQTVRLWEINTLECLRVLRGHTHSVNAAVFSPDGRHVLSGSVDHTVRLWEVRTGRCVAVLTGHESSVQTVAFNKDGEYAISGSSDKTIRLWDLKDPSTEDSDQWSYEI